MKLFVIMGVAGCGKSSVGAAVAGGLGADFVDGDDLHPQSNIDKMARGLPLDDTDRAPWLEAVGHRLSRSGASTVIACSALKRSYRDVIRQAAHAPVTFLHLHGTRKVIEDRMRLREGHFMPVSLLDSQFATLESLQADEDAVLADIDQPFDSVVQTLLEGISSTEQES